MLSLFMRLQGETSRLGLKYSLRGVISLADNVVTFYYLDLAASCCDETFLDFHLKPEEIFKQSTFEILRHGQEWTENIVETIKSADPATCDSMI